LIPVRDRAGLGDPAKRDQLQSLLFCGIHESAVLGQSVHINLSFVFGHSIPLVKALASGKFARTPEVLVELPR
jgi:hypothetical protein